MLHKYGLTVVCFPLIAMGRGGGERNKHPPGAIQITSFTYLYEISIRTDVHAEYLSPCEGCSARGCTLCLSCSVYVRSYIYIHTVAN